MRRFNNIFVLAVSFAFANFGVVNNIQADVLSVTESTNDTNNLESEDDIENFIHNTNDLLHDKLLDKTIVDLKTTEKDATSAKSVGDAVENYHDEKHAAQSLEALESSLEDSEGDTEEESIEEVTSEAFTEEESIEYPVYIAPTAAPIISSSYSQYSTGNITSQSSCITLTDEQIGSILQSVGTVSDTRKAMLQAALQKVGRVPYVWGGGHSSYKGEPTGMDCSAFVGYILYHYASIDLNGLNCAGMADAFRKGMISKSWVCSANELVAGDLIIRLTGGTNHVVIYVGRNQYGLPMVIDEFGTDTVGNVMYQQKQAYYFDDGQSVFVHLDI